MDLLELRHDVESRFCTIYFPKKSFYQGKSLEGSSKNILKAKLTVSVFLSERFSKETILLPNLWYHCKSFYFLIEDDSCLSSSYFKEIFETDQVKAIDRYFGVQLYDITATGITFKNNEEKEFLRFFYSYNVIGILLSRFFANTDFVLTDKGIFYPKKKMLLRLTDKELLELLKLPYPLSVSTIEEVASILISSPYYSKLYFETLPFYKMKHKEKHVATILNKFKNCVKKKFSTSAVCEPLNPTLTSLFKNIQVQQQTPTHTI